MKIVVIGGTGLIGSRLVPKLRVHGHDVHGVRHHRESVLRWQHVHGARRLL